MTDFDRAHRAAAGDIEAFEALYRKYQPMCERIARRITGCAVAAEDVTSDVWLGLACGRWRLDATATPPDGQLHNFIATLAHQGAILLRFRRTALARHTIDDPEPVFTRLHATALDPETLLIRRELNRRLREAIASLPKQYRRVAIYRYYGEMSGPDIAALVGVKPCTIPTYLQTIRKKIRAALVGHINLPARVRKHRRFARRPENCHE